MSYERRPRTERGRFRLTPRWGWLLGFLVSICLQMYVLVISDEPLTFSLTLAGVIIAFAVVHGLFAAWVVSRRKKPTRCIPLEEHVHTCAVHYEGLGLCFHCPECHRLWRTKLRVDGGIFGLCMLLTLPLAFSVIPLLNALQTLNNEHLSSLLYMDTTITAELLIFALSSWLVYRILRRKQNLAPYVGTEKTEDWWLRKRIPRD